MFDSVTAKCYSLISSGIVSFLTKLIHCHHLEYKEKASKRIPSVKMQSILWQKHSAFQNTCPKNANFSPFLLSESRSGMVGFFHNTGTCSSRTIEIAAVLCFMSPVETFLIFCLVSKINLTLITRNPLAWSLFHSRSPILSVFVCSLVISGIND